MNHADTVALGAVEKYFLGELSVAERDEFEAHFFECAECASQLQALEAMREEYPNMDAGPVLETIDGHKAIGHDVAFFSFDMTNSCSIRCYQTTRHTVLLFGQWSELDADETQLALKALQRSVADLGD